MDRRTFLRRGLVALGVAAVGPLVELRTPVAGAHPALSDPPIVRVTPVRHRATGYAVRLPEHWDIPDLVRAWQHRPSSLWAPSRVRLSSRDYTNYVALLGRLKRWYPERTPLDGPLRGLTLMGVPVIEETLWKPGFLLIEA